MKQSLQARQVRLCAPPLEPLMTSKGAGDQGCMLAAEGRYNPATLHWMLAPRAALQSGFRVFGHQGSRLYSSSVSQGSDATAHWLPAPGDEG